MSESGTTETDRLQAKDLFRCSTCWKAFTEEQACYDHMLRHLQQTSDNDTGNQVHKGVALYQKIKRKRMRKYVPCTKCVKCEKECNTKEQLREHKKTHTVRTHCCEICGKNFPKASSLATHKISHTEERPFQCDFCGKAYKTKVLLTFHIRLHTRKDLVHCEKCGKEFTKPGQLKAHQLCHSDERPFVCEVCGFGCKTKADLVRHSNVHASSRLKLYKCDKCGRSYYKKRSLEKHICRMTCTRKKQKLVKNSNKQNVGQTNIRTSEFDRDNVFVSNDIAVSVSDRNGGSSSQKRNVNTSVRDDDSSSSVRQNKDGHCSALSVAHHAGRGSLLQIALPQSMSNGQAGQVRILTLDIGKFGSS